MGANCVKSSIVNACIGQVDPHQVWKWGKNPVIFKRILHMLMKIESNLMKSSGMISLWLPSSMQRSPGQRSYDHQKESKSEMERENEYLKKFEVTKVKVTMTITVKWSKSEERESSNDSYTVKKVAVMMKVKRNYQNLKKRTFMCSVL